MPTRNLAIRLSVKDHEVVERALKGLGTEGERTFTKIERAAKKPTAGMRALNTTVREGRGYLDDFARGLGPVGTGLSALGTGGLAAAAGIGAMTLAVGVAFRQAQQAITVFDQLDDSAQRIGTSAQSFQELRFAFGQVGVESGKVERGLIKLNDSIGEIALKGDDAPKEIRDAFRALGVEVIDTTGKIKSTDQVLSEVADGLRGMGTTAEQTAALAALVGQRVAGEMLPALRQGAAGIDAFRQQAHDAGAVLSQDLVDALSKAGDQLAALDIRLEVENARAFARFADDLVATKGFVVNLYTAINDLVEALDAAKAPVADFFDGIVEGALAANETLGQLVAVMSNALQLGGASSSAFEGIGQNAMAGAAAGVNPGLRVELNRPGGVDYGTQFGPDLKQLGTAATGAAAALKQISLKPPPLSRQEAFYLNNQDAAQSTGPGGTAAPGSFRSAQDVGLTEGLDLSAELAAQAADKDARRFAEAWERAGADLRGVFDSVSQAAGQTFTDLIFGAEMTADEIIRSLAKIATSSVIQGAIRLGVSAAFAAAGPEQGAGAQGGTAGGGGSGGGAGGGGGGFFAGIFHGGGVVGIDSAPQRMLPLSMLDQAPRLHSGLMSDEYPAVLQSGESVLTPAQMRAAGNRPVNVVINNNAGVDVQARDDGNGNVNVDIDRILASRARSGGAFSHAIRDTSDRRVTRR